MTIIAVAGLMGIVVQPTLSEHLHQHLVGSAIAPLAIVQPRTIHTNLQTTLVAVVTQVVVSVAHEVAVVEAVVAVVVSAEEDS